MYLDGDISVSSIIDGGERIWKHGVAVALSRRGFSLAQNVRLGRARLEQMNRMAVAETASTERQRETM